MDKINKKDLIEIIAEDGHLSKKDAKTAADIIFEQMENALLNGVEVNITNFGSFIPKTKKQRIGTNPKSHKRITLKEKKTITFKPCKELKEKLND